MAFRIIKATDPIEVKRLCCLIYGQPGSRKTSLAQTAEEPFTLAFDEGIYRAYGRKDHGTFDCWADVLSADDVLAPYKTVIVDTVGMALDLLARAIVAESPKNGNRLGGLSIQGYGVLKTQFAAWVNKIRGRGQQLLFTAHEKAERNGEAAYYCPDIVGGSYNTLMNHCDIVGYMHFADGRRVIDFNPTDAWMAKTPPCGWGTLAIPDFAAEPHYLARLLAEARASMGRISEVSATASRALQEWQGFLAGDPGVNPFNEKLPEIGRLTNGTKAQIWALAQKYAQAQGWQFDKARKGYFIPDDEPAAEEIEEGVSA